MSGYEFFAQLFPDPEGTPEVAKPFPSIQLCLTDGMAGPFQQRFQLQVHSRRGIPDKFAGDFMGLIESPAPLPFWMQWYGDDKPGIDFMEPGVIPDALHELSHES